MTIRNARGFTLMELLVVLGILALLATILIPKLSTLEERSRSAVQAYSTADVARQLEIFNALNRKYPDGFDTLLAAPAGTTLYSKLAPELKTPNTVLTTVTLTDAQIQSLSLAGVGHAFLHDTAAATVPNNSGNDRRHFGTGTGHDGTANINTFAAVDKTTTSEGFSILVNDFGLNPNRNFPDTSSTPYPRINANEYIVFGLGNKSTFVQSQVMEAPSLDHANSATAYSRALLVYEVPSATAANVGTKAKLVGIIGPDGRTKAMSVSDFNNVSGQQAH